MAVSEHIGDGSPVEADPGVGPGIGFFRTIENESTGSDKKVLVLMYFIVGSVIIKMPLSLQYKVEDIVMADNGSVRLYFGAFFISAGFQTELFRTCLM